MDALTAMLDGPRARGAFLLRALLDPPWSIRIEDEAPLAVFVMGKGDAWLTFDRADPVLVRAGSVALVRGPDHYTASDDPGTAPIVRVDTDEHCWSVADGRSLTSEMALGVRTWGTSPEAPTQLLIGCYDLTSQLTPVLLEILPRVAVIPAEEWSSPLTGLLQAELIRDGPGQEVVLDRLLDLVLIEALRHWLGRPGSGAPPWWLANGDPVVGPALRALQGDPARPWTVASLAAVAQVSRATLARRFTDLVGDSPMAFLAHWRLALAADRLRADDSTIESVARAVGYGSPFALSTAFKRRYGASPSEFRRRAVAERQRVAIGT